MILFIETDYFRITLILNLMWKIFKARILCVWGEFIFNILLHTKAASKEIDHCFCIPMIFQTPFKTRFSIRNKLFFLFVRVWIETVHFLLKKYTFLELIHFSGIRNLWIHFCSTALLYLAIQYRKETHCQLSNLIQKNYIFWLFTSK